jgi:glycosyltransferase involved in cell wall biosynthesis
VPFAPSMVSAPEITVVIPTRNRWPMLRRALDGAFGQEGVDAEIIAIDDGSVDETPQRLSEIDEPRLRVVRHEVSRDVARARNRGIQEASAEWVAFLDDDDLWSPNKLRTQLACVAAERASWVYSAGVLLNAQRKAVAELRPPSPDDLLRLLLTTNVMPGGSSNVVARTELVRSVGGFDESLAQLADWDLWIRLACEATPAVSQEVLVGYVGHDRNMLLEEGRDIVGELEYIAVKHRAERLSEGVTLDYAAFVRFVASGHRRAGRRGRAAATLFRGAMAYRNPENALRGVLAMLGEDAMLRARRFSGRPAAETPAWVGDYR